MPEWLWWVLGTIVFVTVIAPVATMVACVVGAWLLERLFGD